MKGADYCEHLFRAGSATPEEMWDRFIEHYAKKYGFPDNKGKGILVNLIGGIEHYRKEFIEAQQGE